jgi:hypothetical protein
MMLLSHYLPINEAKQLDAALYAKGQSKKLTLVSDPAQALKQMRASLRGSYLFGRHVVPKFASYVFEALARRCPVDDMTGVILRNIIDMCVGELATNNIFDKKGACHAHFYDCFEAYLAAGGDGKEVIDFMTLADEEGTAKAIGMSPGLWSVGSAAYARKLLDVLNDQLSTFIVMPCNEVVTTIVNPVTLQHLPREARFDKFRRFLEVHVQLDGDDHGRAALEWLALHVKTANVTTEEMVVATNRVLALYQ